MEKENTEVCFRCCDQS